MVFPSLLARSLEYYAVTLGMYTKLEHTLANVYCVCANMKALRAYIYTCTVYTYGCSSIVYAKRTN